MLTHFEQANFQSKHSFKNESSEYCLFETRNNTFCLFQNFPSAKTIQQIQQEIWQIFSWPETWNICLETNKQKFTIHLKKKSRSSFLKHNLTLCMEKAFISILCASKLGIKKKYKWFIYLLLGGGVIQCEYKSSKSETAQLIQLCSQTPWAKS